LHFLTLYIILNVFKGIYTFITYFWCERGDILLAQYVSFLVSEFIKGLMMAYC